MEQKIFVPKGTQHFNTLLDTFAGTVRDLTVTAHIYRPLPQGTLPTPGHDNGKQRFFVKKGSLILPLRAWLGERASDHECMIGRQFVTTSVVMWGSNTKGWKFAKIEDVQIVDDQF